jgi:peptide/nickel transport system substrate-binding protein
VQALDNVPRDVLKSVENSGYRIIGSLSFGAWRIGINLANSNGSAGPYSPTGTPIASSPLLREAFEMAIDRRTLNRVVFGGTNVPGCTPLSPAAGDWYTATNVPCTPYDPVQARKLVQQSGYSNPTVQMAYGGDTQTQILAEFIQSEEQAVGINVVLTPLDPATLTARQGTGSYQTYISSVSQVKADPDWIYVSFLNSSGGVYNVWGETNPSLVRDLNNARKAINQQVRALLYHAAQQVIMNDRPVIYLAHILNRAAVKNTIVGAEIRPDQYLRVAFAGFRGT